MLRILTIFGTRPEAIKLAPIIRELQQQSAKGTARSIVCVTGQHRQMLDQVLKLFGIVPDYDFDIMASNQTPTQVAAAVLARLEPILQAERPDCVLVQGDTTTVVSASLAAFYARVKVAHVEAGLRTRDKWQPFPEEINRRTVSVIADLHFAPTEWARQNLLREEVPNENILVTGNPGIDALHWVAEQPVSAEVHELFQRCGLKQGEGRACNGKESIWGGESAVGDLSKSGESLRPTDNSQRTILVTAHRRENFGRPLESICSALKCLAERYNGQVRIVYPVHLNPNVWEPVHRSLGNVPHIALLPPLDYLSLVHVMKHSYLVLTDSGGLQEEAPAFGVPVLVLREVTERPEGIVAGAARLVGTNRDRIVSEATQLLEGTSEYEQMAQAVNPYGDGKAAARIVRALLGEKVMPFEPIGMLRSDIAL